MLKILKSLLLIVLSLTFCTKSHAQFGHGSWRRNPYSEYMNAKEHGWGALMRAYQRMYIGFSYPVIPVDLRSDFVGVKGFSNEHPGHYYPLPDTSIERKLVTAKSWVFSFGTYFGLAKAGKDGELALNLEVTGGYLFAKNDGNLGLEYVAMPLSLEYKSGGEARLNKTKKLLFTIGAGANFYSYQGYMSVSDQLEEDNEVLGIVPFAKIELGYFLGVAFKFGANVNLMPIHFPTLRNEITPGPGYNSNTLSSSVLVNTTIKPGVTISLVVLPFSWDWSDDKWDF